MRILHVCADRGVPVGGTKGASVHLRGIAGALREDGHDVVSVVRRIDADAESFPVPVIPLGKGDGLGLAVQQLGRPDVVLERYSLGHVAGLDLARELGVPFALEVNAPLVAEAARHRPHRVMPEHGPIERRLFRESDLLAVVSNPLKSIIASERGTERGVVVVPNGCDPDAFPPRAEFRGGAVKLAFLGHPKPWHGADRLPALLALLCARGDDVTLEVIGGGPGAQVVQQRSAELGVGGRVVVTGAIPPEEAARRLSRCDILVAPYPRLEPFYFCPLKVIEGMAAGVAVVTTRQGDLPAIVGDAGLLADPDDERDLLDVVGGLVRDPGSRARLGARGRRRARDRFSWRAAAGKLVDVMRGATGGAAEETR